MDPYWKFDPDNYCEGCAAVIDQEHMPECSVWLEQIRNSPS